MPVSRLAAHYHDGAVDEVGKYLCPHPLAERDRGGAHRLDLAVAGVDRLEGADAEQGAGFVPEREEADRAVAQAVNWEDVTRRGRRFGAHLGEMQREQGTNVRVIESP